LPVRRAFTGETAAKLPISVELDGAVWTHFGRVLGVNDWSDFDVVIVVGREQMPPEAAERVARAVYCDDPDELNLTGEYITEVRGHRLASGKLAGVEVAVHPDPRVQGIVERSRERGICQAIDRLRLIHGRPDREVIILCDLPLPGIVVDQYVPLREILDGGTRYQRAWEATGVLPTGAAHLAAAHPELWRSRNAAKEWMKVHGGVTGVEVQLDTYCTSTPVKIAYRPVDRRGGPVSHAYVDAGRHPDLRAGLEAAIGRVSHFEVIEPASMSPASAPAVQRRTGVIVDAGPAPALFELAAFFAETVAAHPPVEVPTGFRLPKRSARIYALDIPFLEAPSPPPPPCGMPDLRVVAPPAPAASVPSYDALFGDELDPFLEEDRIEAIRRWMQPAAPAGSAADPFPAVGALF
jgi:hypothetical protein